MCVQAQDGLEPHCEDGFRRESLYYKVFSNLRDSDLHWQPVDGGHEKKVGTIDFGFCHKGDRSKSRAAVDIDRL